MYIYTNIYIATNFHTNKYTIKSATLQKFPIRNMHNKLNIFQILI